MKRIISLLILAFLLGKPCMATDVVKGVSRELAVERAQNVRNVKYDLTFHIPANRQTPVKGEATICFSLKGKNDDLQLDFQGNAAQFDGSCTVNGKEHTAQWTNEHIIIERKWLKRGRNSIQLKFICGDKSLNRNDDYLYTLFVPDHARSVFPCFDQPDLKALFRTQLRVPEGWETLTSVSTEHIPTYLYSFVAGNFKKQTAIRSGRTITALYRETDPKKVAQLDTVFNLVEHSIKWYEHYTGIPYPFSSYGFVVLPGYQFGGMEHPGAIQFTDHEIFLGEHPTPEELQTRLELVAHETAHCWFGDDVTMRWFDDVWTKEVFANFLASKIAQEVYPHVNHDLNFLRMYQTRALSTDRTPGTHPIQQQLANLNSAGLLYGNIIYEKAPVMMRKLEEQMGAQRFREGLQEYLRTYSYGNASWDDLISILDRHAPEAHLKSFSEAWVKQKGMPTISVTWNDNKLIIRQQDPYKRGLCWQQKFTVDAYYQNRMKTIPVNLQDSVKVIELKEKPLHLMPNADGSGYGLFMFDEEAACTKAPQDDLKRFALAMNLYENYRSHRITASRMSSTMLQWLTEEKNAMIGAQLASYWASCVTDMPDGERHKQERLMWNQYRQHPIVSVRQQLIRQLYKGCTDAAVADSVYGVWHEQSDPLLSKTDYTQMAYRLALLKPSLWQSILSLQRSRLTNVDELRQFDFISRACSPDDEALQALFNSLLKAENRRIEPWTASVLRLLNDRVREPQSNRYLKPGLDVLLEVQQTGDIFFPGNWLSALLGDHHSQEAKSMVEGFIREHPDYPEKLMNKLKENAYSLLTM